MRKIRKFNDGYADTLKLIAGSILLITGILILSGYAEAYEYGKKMSCGNDTLCQSIQGKEFNMILFSEFGSELVILYDKSSVGEINVAVSGSPYREETGTVLDAVLFLSKTVEYRTFTTSRAIKSVGWFGSERIDDMYIISPIFDDSYLNDAAKYVIRDRGGRLELNIKPVYDFGRD